MTLTYFYFTLPDSNVKFLYTSRFTKRPSRFKVYKNLMRMLDADKIGSCGFTHESADLDFYQGGYSIDQAKRRLDENERRNKLKMRERIKSYAQEDDELKLLNFKTMSDSDVKYYFEKYLDSGNGQGHL